MVIKTEETTIEKKIIEKSSNETVSKKLPYKVQRELELIEESLPQLEQKKLELENKLAVGITDYGEIQKISNDLQLIIKELDEKSLRWLQIQEM